MRVLTVSEPGRDGVFRHVEALVPHLIEAGVRVDLAYSSRRGCDDLPRLVERVRASGGETLDLRVGNAPSPADVRALFALLALARRTRPDVVHGHSSKAGGLTRLLAGLHPGPRYFYTPHAYFGLGRTGGARLAVFNTLERLLRGVGRTIHVSDDENRFGVEVLGLDPRRTVVIGHGIDTDRFRPATPDERAALRREFGIPPTAAVVGAMGRMGPQKDYPTLYHALRQLLDAREDVHVLQVGTGPLAPEVHALARQLRLGDRLHAVDEVADASRFHRACDLVLMTSTYEAGIPYVALEALATGAGMVVTRAPGLRRLLDRGFSQVRGADVGDARSVAREALALLEERVDRARPNDHRERIVAEFDQHRSVDRILAEYRRSLDPDTSD